MITATRAQPGPTTSDASAAIVQRATEGIHQLAADWRLTAVGVAGWESGAAARIHNLPGANAVAHHPRWAAGEGLADRWSSRLVMPGLREEIGQAM